MPMSSVMRLNQNQNDSTNSILQMVICWKRLFCGMHCFMISICHTESHFNDGTNERYHLFIHHKKLEQLKKTEHETLLLLKSPQNTTTSIKYCYH